MTSPGHEPGRGIINLRGSYQITPDTVQNASAEKTRVWVICACAVTRKQLADEKLEHPILFKEALLEEYREREIYEKPPSLIVVELEHPHFLYKADWISHKLPQEVSIFEFEKTESGTLSYGKEPPRLRWHGQVPIPRSRREDRHAKFCRFAAWIRALAWWCEELEDRLQPPSTSALLRPAHEPVVKQEPQRETDKSEQSASRPQQRLDSTRVAVEAIESHAVASPAPPQAQVVGTRKGAAPTDNLIPVAASSEERAKTVARIITELNTLEPQMYGEAAYEDLKEHHPGFLTFVVSERQENLKVLLVNIKESKRHIRLAQQCAAHYHGKRLVTIKSDWKHHKPENFRSKKTRKKP